MFENLFDGTQLKDKKGISKTTPKRFEGLFDVPITPAETIQQRRPTEAPRERTDGVPGVSKWQGIKLPPISPEGLVTGIKTEEFPKQDIGGGLSTFAKGLKLLPRQVAAKVVMSLQGSEGASVVNPDWGDRFVESAQQDMEGFVKTTQEQYGRNTFLPGIPITEIASLPQNLAYSAVSGGAALTAGAPVAALPVPGARPAAWGVGVATSAKVAYEMSTYEIMQAYLETMNEEMQEKQDRGITAEEEEKLKEAFNKKAQQYGLWEAVPEAIGQAVFAKILITPLTKMIGGSLAGKVAVKLTGLYGEELITETITQMGQRQVIEEDVDWTSTEDWLTSLKEVAPQTFLLTTVMAGAGQTGISAKHAIESLSKEIGEEHPLHDKFEEKITETKPEEITGVAIEIKPEVKPEVKPEAKPEIKKKRISPEEQEKLLTGVKEAESRIRNFYKTIAPEAVEKAMGEIWVEMEISEAGARIPIVSPKEQPGREVIGMLGKTSSFPQWIPEHLRSRKLFDKVMEGLMDINSIKFPEQNRSRQRELYNLLLAEVDSKVGLNTRKLRQRVINNYGKIYETKPKEIKKGVGVGIRGEVSGGEIDISKIDFSKIFEEKEKPLEVKPEVTREYNKGDQVVWKGKEYKVMRIQPEGVRIKDQVNFQIVVSPNELSQPEPSKDEFEAYSEKEILLPKDLVGAKPRYGYQQKLFTLRFKSDIDKALYIVAQTKRSKADARYMDFLRDVYSEDTDESIRNKGAIVRSAIKELAREAEPGNLVVEKVKQSKGITKPKAPPKFGAKEQIKERERLVLGKDEAPKPKKRAKPALPGQKGFYLPPAEFAKTNLFKQIEKAKRETKGGNLAYLPEGLKQDSTSKEFIQETDKIVKRSEIAKSISEKLNVPIRRGKFKVRAAGIYKLKKEIVRVKSGGLVTIIHEIGHSLEDLIPEIASYLRGWDLTEVKSLVEEYPAKVEGIARRREALAEFLRFYIGGETAKAKRKAPKFYKFFEQQLEKYPEIKEVLLTAKRDYARWRTMPSTAKVLSQISIKEEKAGLKERFIGNLDELQRLAIDDLSPLDKFVKLAKKEGVEVNLEDDPYILARLSRGWVAKATTFIERGTFGRNFWKREDGRAVPAFTGKSFKAILQPIAKKNAIEDFTIYLVAKRSLELSSRGIKTGVAAEDARASIAELEKRHSDFAKTAEELYKYQDKVLLYGFQSGLYDARALNKMKKMNKSYVPFYRVFEELQAKGYLGKKLAAVSGGIKRIKGSERDIINPLESIIKNTYTVISAADRNQVGIKMAELAQRNKELGKLFEKVPTPMAKVATINTKEILEKAGILDLGGSEEMVDIFRPSIFLPKDNVITVLMNGKKNYYQVDPSLYKALMATDIEGMGLLWKIFSTPAKWLRAGATLAPEFGIRNPIRDLTTAFVFSKYGFVPIVDNVKALFSMVKKDNDYLLWKMGGGEHSMLVSLDRRYLQKSFDEVLKGKPAIDYVKNPLELLRLFGEASEKLNRLPEAKSALSKGKSPLAAAYASREVTLDFARAGVTGRAVNRIVAFWNANIQSWDKLIRQFKERPTQTTFKALMGITLPSVLLFLVNKDKPEWKRIPQWQKDLFWIVILEDKIIRIPKPFQLGIIFGTIPERAMQAILEKDPKAFDSLADLALTEVKDLIPIPTAVSPMIEAWGNYSIFRKRAIVPVSLQGLPQEAQYTTYTPEAVKLLGDAVNYSPLKIEHLLKSYFGGLSAYATKIADSILAGTGISSTIPKPSETLADKPVLKGFIVRRPIGSASASVNRFYENMKKYEEGEKLLKQYIRTDEQKKFYEYKNKHPELFFTYDWETKAYYSAPARYYRALAREMSELRKIEREIYASKELSPKVKREKIDKVNEIITQLAEKALEMEIK